MKTNHRFESDELKPWQPNNNGNNNCCNNYYNTIININLDHYDYHRQRQQTNGTFDIVERDELGQWKRKSHPCCYEIQSLNICFLQNHANRHNDDLALIPWQSPEAKKCSTASNIYLDLNRSIKDDNDHNTFEIVTRDELGQWKRKSHPCCQDIVELAFRKILIHFTGLDRLVSEVVDTTLMVFDEVSINSDVTFVDIPPPLPSNSSTAPHRNSRQWSHGTESPPASQHELHHYHDDKKYSESPVVDVSLDGTIKLLNEETGSVVLGKMNLTDCLPSDLIRAIQNDNDNIDDDEVLTTTPLLPLPSLNLSQDTVTTNYDPLFCSNLTIEWCDFDDKISEFSDESTIDYRDDDNGTIFSYKEDSFQSSCPNLAQVAPIEVAMSNIDATVPNIDDNDYRLNLATF